MRVLVYGINYSPEVTGIGRYTSGMTSHLVCNDFTVRVITANPYYPEWKVNEGFKPLRYSKTVEQGIKVIRCPLFVPNKPNILLRILHLISFAISSFFPVMKMRSWKPQLIILIAPTMFCALNALLLAKITGSKVLIHIQDFEVDAMFDLGMSKFGALRIFAQSIERYILNRFDLVSTISPGMLDVCRSKNVPEKNLVLLQNWCDVNFNFDEHSDSLVLRKFSLNPDSKVVLYSGNVGEKQGLDLLLQLAKSVGRVDKNIRFLIVGEGTNKLKLIDLANKLGLKNLDFFPLLSAYEFPYLIQRADCHFVIQKELVTDAFLPSKFANILYAGGRCIVCAPESSYLHRFCMANHGVAFVPKSFEIEHVQATLFEVLAMSGKNEISMQYAKTFLDKDVILKEFSDRLKAGI